MFLSSIHFYARPPCHGHCLKFLQTNDLLNIFPKSKLSPLHKVAHVFKNTILIMSFPFIVSHYFWIKIKLLIMTLRSFLACLCLPLPFHIPSLLSTSHLLSCQHLHCVPAMLRATHAIPSASFLSSLPSNELFSFNLSLMLLQEDVFGHSDSVSCLHYIFTEQLISPLYFSHQNVPMRAGSRSILFNILFSMVNTVTYTIQ